MLVNIIIWDLFHIVNNTKLKFVKKYNNQNRISHIGFSEAKYANRIIAYRISHIAYSVFEKKICDLSHIRISHIGFLSKMPTYDRNT